MNTQRAVIMEQEDWPRIRGHIQGENKYRPIVRSLRTSPRPIQECVQYLLEKGQVEPNSPRKAAADAIKAVLKPAYGLDLSAFRGRGVSPVDSYVQKRIIRIVFLVGPARKTTFIVRMYENDLP